MFVQDSYSLVIWSRFITATHEHKYPWTMNCLQKSWFIYRWISSSKIRKARRVRTRRWIGRNQHVRPRDLQLCGFQPIPTARYIYRCMMRTGAWLWVILQSDTPQLQVWPGVLTSIWIWIMCQLTQQGLGITLKVSLTWWVVLWHGAWCGLDQPVWACARALTYVVMLGDMVWLKTSASALYQD